MIDKLHAQSNQDVHQEGEETPARHSPLSPLSTAHSDLTDLAPSTDTTCAQSAEPTDTANRSAQNCLLELCATVDSRIFCITDSVL